MFNLELLKEIYRELTKKLPTSTVIAGGAVRDALLEREPKDIDIFVLGHRPEIYWGRRGRLDFDDCKFELRGENVDYGEGSIVLGDGETSDGIPFQVMTDESPNVETLLDRFDWNICQFAMTKSGLVTSHSVTDLLPGRPLILLPYGLGRNETKLSSKAYKAGRTLDRGKEFSERYNMILRLRDKQALQSIIDEHERVEQEKREQIEFDYSFRQATSVLQAIGEAMV